MAPDQQPTHIDTAIIGNGPAALILSFILHGNIPYYNLEHPHPDPILHAKLARSPCLLDADVDDLTAHFDASRISYSTQALPANVLLDTLLRPLADVEPGEYASAVTWKHSPHRAVDHIVLGQGPKAGGQWADNPVTASWDIGALSYLDQLSLPGYTLYDHLKTSKQLSSSTSRPTRRQLADYFATYPSAAGIDDCILSNSTASGVRRVQGGFYISSHNLYCKNLVLASGIFTKLIPPPASLVPLNELNTMNGDDNCPMLVVGSGFSAADIIISNVENRKILHIFKWQPDEKPSPLQACHPQAYPEYAGVYRQMKSAAKKCLSNGTISSPPPRKLKPFFDDWVWKENYEGFPNGSVREICQQEGKVSLAIDIAGQDSIEREVGAFACVIGRMGSLDYLDEDLQMEVLGAGNLADPGLPQPRPNQLISASALREKTLLDVEVTKDVYAIGSLTGDSLIRFAYGSCVQTAGRVMSILSRPTSTSTTVVSSPRRTPERCASPVLLDTYQLTNGHADLGRRHAKEGDGPGKEESLLMKHDDEGNDEHDSSCKCCIDLEHCIIL